MGHLHQPDLASGWLMALFVPGLAEHFHAGYLALLSHDFEYLEDAVGCLVHAAWAGRAACFVRSDFPRPMEAVLLQAELLEDCDDER